MTRRITGIAWGHTRGLLPLVATSQRLAELEPDLSIDWRHRSLDAFGHADVLELAKSFDLVVVDHPWMGFAAARGCLLPLGDRVDDRDLAGWRAAVGDSFRSYLWEGELYAAPIDAASPAAAVREGTRTAEEPPRTWDDVLELARSGRVLAPCFPPDLLLHLVMLLVTEGVPIFDGERIGPEETVIEEMARLRELVKLLPPRCGEMNPIAVYEALASGGEAEYCPFAFSYSNYARADYGLHRLRFLHLPTHPSGAPLRGVLGGTGLAISAFCRDRELALRYLRFTASAEVQRGIFALSGGQPAHSSAWESPDLDAHANRFFSSTREAVERAWTRPRYYGYPYFQKYAGRPLLEWARHGGDPRKCLEEMDNIYRYSLSLSAPAAVT